MTVCKYTTNYIYMFHITWQHAIQSQYILYNTAAVNSQAVMLLPITKYRVLSSLLRAPLFLIIPVWAVLVVVTNPLYPDVLTPISTGITCGARLRAVLFVISVGAVFDDVTDPLQGYCLTAILAVVLILIRAVYLVFSEWTIELEITNVRFGNISSVTTDEKWKFVKSCR